MKIRIRLSDTCRKALFLGGIETPQTVNLEPPLDALFPSVWVIIWDLPYGNQPGETLLLQFPGENQYVSDIYPVTPSDWTVLLRTYALARTVWATEQNAKRADAEQAFPSQPPNP
jgi:hypothetical protein